MAGRRQVVEGRRARTSHFEQEVEMTPVSHPSHRQGGEAGGRLPRTYPGQGPALRTLPPSLVSPTPLLEEHTRTSSPHISADNLRRLQDIVEAQKSFLKFQQMREVLLAPGRGDTRSSDSDKENSVVVTTSRSGRQRKVASLRVEAKEGEQAKEGGEVERRRKRRSPAEFTSQEVPPPPVKSPRCHLLTYSPTLPPHLTPHL